MTNAEGLVIAVIGPPHDPQAARVEDALKQRGEPTLFLDATAFPESLRMTLSPDGWHINERAAPSIRAAYIRATGGNPLSPRHEAELAVRPRGVVAQCAEKRAFLRGWLNHLEANGCVLVNTPEANDQHQEKPRQLGLLERANLPVPPWIATNDPAVVQAFAHEHPLVYKPLAGGATVHAVTPEDLDDERLEALALAPVLFQRRIDGLALRAYVVGGVVVAAVAIHSEAIDYRGNETAVEAITLTDAESEIAVRAAAACGMAFSGVDIIRDAEGRPWLLECNPSPMFAAIEDATGVRVAEPLAEYLAATARHA